jgi:Uma2 family endonuclease
MSTSIAPPPGPPTIGPRKRWTTAEFDRLVTEGYIREGSGSYLWNGEIIEPMAENRPHRNAVANLCRLLLALAPQDTWTVDQGTPIALRDGFKPQPDLVVLVGPRSRYRTRVPTPSDVSLLVEVSDSTYGDDRGEFLREYAVAGVPRYWIVNIPARRLEVYEVPQHSQSGSPWYRDRMDHDLDQSATVVLSPAGNEIVGQVSVREVLRDSLDPVLKEERE